MATAKRSSSIDSEQCKRKSAVEFKEIHQLHIELCDEFKKLQSTDILSADLFDQIEQWKVKTIKKIERAAEVARSKAIESINKKKQRIQRKLKSITNEIQSCKDTAFLEKDLEKLKLKVNEVETLLQKIRPKSNASKVLVYENEDIDWDRIVFTRFNKGTDRSPSPNSSSSSDNDSNLISRQLKAITLDSGAQWQRNGITVAGGYGQGSDLNQLDRPYGLYVDDDQTVYIAEWSNHRVVEWKLNEKHGRVIAGGNGPGNKAHQLFNPVSVILDHNTDSFIISDGGNNRVVRWPRRNGSAGEVIISNICSTGLAMDESGALYVADYRNHEVRRYVAGDRNGVVVAGGHGRGRRSDQLSKPTYIFLDQNGTLYVSEHGNNRVTKWVKNASEGQIISNNGLPGNDLARLHWPEGIVVDQSGTVYVVEQDRDRVVRWPQQAEQSSVVVGGNGRGIGNNQLNQPFGLFIDRHGSIYVADSGNHRVQKFYINSSLDKTKGTIHCD